MTPWRRRFSVSEIEGARVETFARLNWPLETGGAGISMCRPERLPCRRGLNIPTDCLRCGVCCHGETDTYVRVSGDDWSRLGADVGRLVHFIGNRAFMKMAGGRCGALALREAAGAGGGTEYFCTVYSRRPQVCRDLGRGSPECEGELVRKGAALKNT